MNQRPLATVCIPVFNKKPYLAKTLEVILSQTYAPLEVVVSDNGSTDGSGEVAKDFAARDSRIRYFRLESTININESWRYCYQLAQGEFLKLHSGDDTTLQSDFLELMIEPMLRHAEIEFTICAVRAMVEYSDTGLTQANQAYFNNLFAEFCRELTLEPVRERRARKLLEQAALSNNLGSNFGLVCRRSCLPLAHWRKGQSPFAWPESFPDWDLLIHLFLEHSGYFVDGVASVLHYDANSPACRFLVDNRYDLYDNIGQMLLSLTVLLDPELAALRQQAQPGEMAGLTQEVQRRIQGLVDIADEIVAFDHPHFTAKLLPRLNQYIGVYRLNPQDWIAARRVRQLRMKLVQHWLGASTEQIRQEYAGDAGRAQRMLLESGIRRANLDIREKELLENTFAEVTKGMAEPASWGRWLALVLLVNFQNRPNLTLAMVPVWLREDFAKYAWMA